jgi:hypothetical protein
LLSRAALGLPAAAVRDREEQLWIYSHYPSECFGIVGIVLRRVRCAAPARGVSNPDDAIKLSSKSVRRIFVYLALFLPAITGIPAAGQSSSTLCAPTAHAVVLYAPEPNLERSEIETLRTAKISVDVAMYNMPVFFSKIVPSTLKSQLL